jgi:hypothetical protein
MPSFPWSPSEDVLAAWTNPGPHPPTHWKAQADLRRDWPVLAQALDRLAASAH